MHTFVDLRKANVAFELITLIPEVQGSLASNRFELVLVPRGIHRDVAPSISERRDGLGHLDSLHIGCLLDDLVQLRFEPSLKDCQLLLRESLIADEFFIFTDHESSDPDFGFSGVWVVVVSEFDVVLLEELLHQHVLQVGVMPLKVLGLEVALLVVAVQVRSQLQH